MKRVVDINLIRENPLCKELFGDLPDGEFVLLKQDIEYRGVQIPIEVTPDNTVVSGHQRLRAQKELGAKEIEVVVREDLKNEEEIQLHAFKDNLFRRHLSAEQKVEIVKYLVKKYGGFRGRPRKGGQVAPFLEGKGRTRERVAKLVGISKRSVDKYLKLAELPEGEKRKVLKKERRMKEALARDIGEEVLDDCLAEETDKPPEAEFLFGDDSVREFDPLAEIEGGAHNECVRCGGPACVSGAEDGPAQFMSRLITEFVKEPQKTFCHECLYRLYEHLGHYVRENWEKILEKTSC